MAAIVVSLVPNNNYEIPQSSAVNYGDYSEMETQFVIGLNSQINENKHAEILLSFASKLAENTKDINVEIAQIIINDFWEMYD